MDPGADESSEDGGVSPQELATMAHHGSSFDWLAEEPEIYSDTDGEPSDRALGATATRRDPGRQ